MNGSYKTELYLINSHDLEDKKKYYAIMQLKLYFV